MALASWPARQGKQRSLRRIRQVLSWAFALPPDDVAQKIAGQRLQFSLQELAGHDHALDLVGALVDLSVVRPGLP
jgi:hypothetical protein